jgi:peptidyl-dipeptidase Dcp
VSAPGRPDAPTDERGQAGGAPAASPANPLLQPWDTPHGLPPFGAIAPAYFEPALHEAMRQHRAEVERIGTQAAPPDFENTSAALDRAGALLERVASCFFNLTSSATGPELQAAERALAAPLAAHFSAVQTDPRLFARLDELHRRRGELGLDAVQRRLLERQHLDCVRTGAMLPPAARERHAAILQELAGLMTRFAQNVLHDECHDITRLPDEAALAGLPPFVRAAARQAAVERGLEGHVITPSRSLVVPFLTFSTRRDLREAAWRAWVGRGEHAGEHDNRALARRIVELRREQGALHGHASYADYALVDTMAGSPQAVAGLLNEVWPRALAAVQAERAALLEEIELARAAGETVPEAAGLQPWDWRYWAERVRSRRYALDDAEIKPYFKLENIVAAAFDCAQRLFGLVFTRRDDLPTYHPDVVAYEVHRPGGELVGVFMQDNYARSGKRSGAWMSSLRIQSGNGKHGPHTRPLVLNNNNFARGEPTLLSMDDARTLFHEFGHGLHGLLSNVRYQRLAGTQVLRDFVELPSQLFEHWILEREVLRRHARHWQTGEAIPDALIDRLQAASRFNQGYETVRYTASSLVDLHLHSRTEPEPPADLVAWENELLDTLGCPRAVGTNHRVVHFQHLFSSAAYASQYYVYLWAEVLDADGYDAFVEAGNPFDPATAERLYRHIYSVGNSVPPQETYAAFRGRAATVQPLLRKRGLVPA